MKTTFWKRIDFDANWHKWSTGKWHETINLGIRVLKFKVTRGQGRFVGRGIILDPLGHVAFLVIRFYISHFHYSCSSQCLTNAQQILKESSDGYINGKSHKICWIVPLLMHRHCACLQFDLGQSHQMQSIRLLTDLWLFTNWRLNHLALHPVNWSFNKLWLGNRALKLTDPSLSASRQHW